MISHAEFDRLKDIVLDELYGLTDYLSPEQARKTTAIIMHRVTDRGGLLDADRIEALQVRVGELLARIAELESAAHETKE